jgi:hypothetical protein
MKPMFKSRDRRRIRPRPLVLEALEDRMLLSTCMISLSPSEPPPQLVGERITWAATASKCGENPVYQFNVRPTGGPFRVVRDFSPGTTFTWTPMQEGSYDIQVTVKDGYQATDTVSAVVSDVVNSRVTGSHAVITATPNPLVALYSAPPASGDTVQVEFAVAAPHPEWRSTNPLPIEPGKSTNFFVAGMLPNTAYEMRHVVTSHHHHHHSSPLLFTTGAIQPSLVLPTFTVIQPPGPESDLNKDMIFHQFAKSASNVPNPLATDLQGQVVWHYDVLPRALLLPSQARALCPAARCC